MKGNQIMFVSTVLADTGVKGVEKKRDAMEASIVRKIPEASIARKSLEFSPLAQQPCRHQARGISGLEGMVRAFGSVDIALFELAEAAPLLVSGVSASLQPPRAVAVLPGRKGTRENGDVSRGRRQRGAQKQVGRQSSLIAA